ncbi:MAG TPA: type-F conjugative transfer system pilin assembly protein TrbC [Agitococcus sp.]|nr:type-F conjugative transfer system pilin assembly protein TrbC [Agitococcus sp.]
MLRFISVLPLIISVAYAQDSYQEPSKKDMDLISNQIQKQLDAAAQVQNDSEFLKNRSRAVNQIKTMPVPTTMPMINIREEDISTNGVDMQALENQVNVIEADRMTPFVLVSFSMSSDTLKNLSQEMSRIEGSIAFRGAKNDDLRKMRDEFARLGLEGQIDPSLFKRFEVQEVPTFILPLEPVPHCESDACPAGKYIKVSGLVSLESALEFISRNSREKNAKAIAEQWLDKLRGT